jgi:23S rRNA pseudouridine1911/1915/1917 synthase
VHRIDRDTSGLVLFAKNEPAQLALKRQFERRTAQRTYLAVLEGRLAPLEGTWQDKLVWDKAHLRQRRATEDDEQVAKEAAASYRVIEQLEAAAVVEIRLVTGKRNQIRVQAALRRHPLVGERIYRTGDRPSPAPGFDRQALHASRLAFRHPRTGTLVQFEAPLPDDLRRLIARLRRQ